MDDVKLKPRGLGVGGSTNLQSGSAEINAHVEVPKDPKIEQRFLDAVDRLLVPQGDRERGALEDKGRKASILDAPTAPMTGAEFASMLRRTVTRELTYLLSERTDTLDEPGRRVHGHRISAFIHEAAARARELFAADPGALGAALHEITFHAVSLFSNLNTPRFRDGGGALAGLTAEQRSVWLEPMTTGQAPPSKYAHAGVRSQGSGELDPSNVGFEIRVLRPATPGKSFAELAALAATLLSGGKKV